MNHFVVEVQRSNSLALESILKDMVHAGTVKVIGTCDCTGGFKAVIATDFGEAQIVDGILSTEGHHDWDIVNVFPFNYDPYNHF